MYLAYDHGLEHGPADFNANSVNPDFVLDIAVKGGFNAVILQKGTAEKYYSDSKYRRQVPLILKLNGKTNLYKGEAYSPQVCEVEEALKLGASAVGYTIYAGSEFEAKMFEEFGKIVREAHDRKIPAIAWVYPVRSNPPMADADLPKANQTSNGVYPREVVAYAGRVALELGADIAKIKYSGSLENFRWAVQAAGKTKIVLSGGPKVSDEEFLEIVKNIMAAGAIGVAVGRNVWQNPAPLALAEKIKEIIFK